MEDTLKLPKVLVIDVNAWRNDAGSNTLREIFSCWAPERLAVDAIVNKIERINAR